MFHRLLPFTIPGVGESAVAFPVGGGLGGFRFKAMALLRIRAGTRQLDTGALRILHEDGDKSPTTVGNPMTMLNEPDIS